MRLIDADKLPLDKIDDANYGSNYICIAPTVDAIPRAQIDEMIKEIEQIHKDWFKEYDSATAYIKISEFIHKYTDKEQT